MINLSTENIVKLLPIDAKLKMELLNELPFMSAEERFRIDDALWTTFYGLYQLKLKENIQKGLDLAEQNKMPLDESFYATIEKQTLDDIEAKATDTIESTDLEAARKAMEQIVQEIRAAKAQKKTS